MNPPTFIPYTITGTLSQLDNIYECRLFGWLLAKAQSALKLYNKNLDEINLQHAINLVRVTLPARYLMSPGDTNYRGIQKAFQLAKKQIAYERDGTEYYLNVIAFPEFQKKGGRKMVTFVIHNAYWNVLIDFSRGYRLINLPTYLTLTNKYAVIMYVIVSQQSDPIHYLLTTLRRLLGCDQNSSYQRGNHFINRVLEPAKKELDEKAPFTFDYTTTRQGRGGAYREITIIPHANISYTEAQIKSKQDDEIARQRLRLTSNVQDYLQNAYAMTPAEQERCERYLLQMGPEAEQLQFLERVRHAARRRGTRNAKGYLVNALKNACQQQ